MNQEIGQIKFEPLDDHKRGDITPLLNNATMIGRVQGIAIGIVIGAVVFVLGLMSHEWLLG